MKENIEEVVERLEKSINDVCFSTLYSQEDEEKDLQILLSDYKRVLKENEILKEEKEQAWEEWNSLEQGSYEIEQKLKQQLKKLQKENEELKADNYELNNRINDLLDSIPVQKVKDKIEELQNNLHTVEHYETIGAIHALQELIEEREEK